MKPRIDEIDEAELAVFKKKVKMLGQFKGKGTELISVYIPEAADRSTVMGQLTEEISQSSNIKSPQTRKNVQGALRKIISFLKNIDFKIPKRGIVTFAGNISESEGRSDIRLFTVRPPRELKTKLYWCDSKFHLDPLQEMMMPSDIYALVTIDKNEATIGVLAGKKYEIIGHFTSGISGKHRAGGQSAQRFERLHEEAANEFYKRISEKVNGVFLPYGEKLKGVVVGGPGMTKSFFINRDLVDYRLKAKIIGTVDTSYTDESGIREIIQKSEQLLKDTDLMKETVLINKFLEQVAKDGLAAYGQKEVEEVLALGKVDRLLLSEGMEWEVVKVNCNNCGTSEEKIIKNLTGYDSGAEKCPKCGGQLEVMEEIDYLDWMIEKAHETGAEVKIVSIETAEGEQFFKGFGGIGAMLRYK